MTASGSTSQDSVSSLVPSLWCYRAWGGRPTTVHPFHQGPRIVWAGDASAPGPQVLLSAGALRETNSGGDPRGPSKEGRWGALAVRPLGPSGHAAGEEGASRAPRHFSKSCSPGGRLGVECWAGGAWGAPGRAAKPRGHLHSHLAARAPTPELRPQGEDSGRRSGARGRLCPQPPTSSPSTVGSAGAAVRGACRRAAAPQHARPRDRQGAPFRGAPSPGPPRTRGRHGGRVPRTPAARAPGPLTSRVPTIALRRPPPPCVEGPAARRERPLPGAPGAPAPLPPHSPIRGAHAPRRHRVEGARPRPRPLAASPAPTSSSALQAPCPASFIQVPPTSPLDSGHQPPGPALRPPGPAPGRPVPPTTRLTQDNWPRSDPPRARRPH